MTVTEVRIVDASALAAVLFEEPAAGLVTGRLRDAALVAPQLLGYELANTCLKKLRSHPDRRDAILLQFAAWTQIDIEFVETNVAGLPRFAESFGLTAYDASYLWLARELKAELVTLDRQLAQAAASLLRA